MSEQKGLRETEIQEGKVISQGHMGNEWKIYDRVKTSVFKSAFG